MVAMASSDGEEDRVGVVGFQGLGAGAGLHGHVYFAGPPKPNPDTIELVHHTVESGVAFLDTSDIYGLNANEVLLGKVGILFCRYN